MNRVVIVGASAGGLATAEALRRAGYRGVITLIGDEPRHPYDRPPLSKQLLAGVWAPERLALRSAADIDGLGLELRLGVPVVDLDRDARSVMLADATEVHYDALVVATGVRARRLSGGAAVLRTLSDALALKAALRPGRRLLIVGAGFIGAEVAATARGLGVEVTLLETAAVPLALAVGVQAGQFLSRIHQDHGVELRTGAAVTGVTSTQVELADGTVLSGDCALLAIGSVPNVEWLAGAGLNLRDGLVCDEYCAAADGIYGVGDVARWYNPLFGRDMRIEHRTNAAEQGMAVARSLLDPSGRRPFAPVPYFWSDQYDTKIQAYGYLRDHDEAVVLSSDPALRRLLVAYRKGDRLTGVLGVGQSPGDLRAWRSLLAAGSPWSAALAAA